VLVVSEDDGVSRLVRMMVLVVSEDDGISS